MKVPPFGFKVLHRLIWVEDRWGSLAGAAHLLKDNAGVLRGTHREQKSRVEQKGNFHVVLAIASFFLG